MADTLQFEESTHTYTLGGRRLPSVTQILKPLYKFNGISPETLNAKAALGTAVHLACELLDKNDLDEETEEGRAGLVAVAGYLAGYKLFLRDMKPVVIANEMKMHHPTMLYAGTLDRRYAIGAHEWDVDLKSTVSMSPIVGLQTAAYTEMQRASGLSKKPARRGALQLFPDGKYKLHEFNDPADLPTFFARLTEHRFCERHGIDL